ncbi:MAG: chalcone isomerase family protein [Sideroxyarcus sp.]|nr:chalcone isomerase family protein [Sideroxyarcus sp.]
MSRPHTIGRSVLAIVLGLMVCVLPVQATSNGVPAHIQNELRDARLSGQGSFRWFGLKIYDAALWVEKNDFQPASPAATKLVLDLRYARDLYGARIAQSSIDEIRQLGFGSTEQQRVWLEKMTALFPDVHEGTHISGVYLPAQGARFYLDGKLLGEIGDAEFARAFFAIWLDARTSAAGLRKQLLASNP